MLDSIFSVDIYRTKFADVSVLERARQAVNDLDFTVINNEIADTYISDQLSRTTRPNQNNLHTMNEFKPLSNFIETESKKYWDMLGYYTDVNPRVWLSWANISDYSESIRVHNHCKSPLTGIVYLEAGDDCGDLVFENPMDLIIGGQPIKMPYKNFVRALKVTTGDVILFPGYIKHYTETNTSNNPRVTYVALLNDKGF